MFKRSLFEFQYKIGPPYRTVSNWIYSILDKKIESLVFPFNFLTFVILIRGNFFNPEQLENGQVWGAYSTFFSFTNGSLTVHIVLSFFANPFDRA